MKKPKKLYQIYEENHLDFGDGHIEITKRKLGTTYAVSEAQAVNNYCYRTNRKPLSGCDWYGDGGRTTFIIAETFERR